jgi:hypothetical protein
MKPRDENSILNGSTINPHESRFLPPTGNHEMISKYLSTSKAAHLSHRGRSELFGESTLQPDYTLPTFMMG